MFKQKKVMVATIIVLLILGICVRIFILENEKSKNKHYADILYLINSTYTNIFQTNIYPNNCELLHITPSYEWLIKKISEISNDDAQEIINSIITSMLNEELENITILELSVDECSQDDIASFNDIMIQSAQIYTSVYSIDCDEEFSYISSAYRINGIIYETNSSQNDTYNFNGIVVNIDGQNYIFEYNICEHMANE